MLWDRKPNAVDEGRSTGNNQPRPEAVVSGRPPRGGRLREVAPVGGVDVEQTKLVLANARQRLVPGPSSDCVPDGVLGGRHAGSLEALRVTRPEAVGLERTKNRTIHRRAWRAGPPRSRNTRGAVATVVQKANIPTWERNPGGDRNTKSVPPPAKRFSSTGSHSADPCIRKAVGLEFNRFT